MITLSIVLGKIENTCHKINFYEYKHLSYNVIYYGESVQSMWSSGMIPASGAGGPEFKSRHGPSFGFGK